MNAGETHQAIEATFRIERARLIAGLARLVRDLDRAEELAQDPLVVALAEWPRTGVPANPGAWLRNLRERAFLLDGRRPAAASTESRFRGARGALDPLAE